MKANKNFDVAQLTTEEKLSLTTGASYWSLPGVESCGLRPVVVSDGPCGLRKEADGKTLPAVCFPSVSKLACSFDTATLREVGAAIGEQCRSNGVDILLAPGVNIKRNPRCGRNFEYFSEDTFLTAELANAYIKGLNSQGVDACIKHFAGNSQEYGRRVCDSVIDERALREIYLYAFEKIIKQSKPHSVMCAYNKLNGEYCSQNQRLLKTILRDEWKFDGIVISDWGATDDRVKGILNGLNVEMPQGDLSDVKNAVANGTLLHADLDKSIAETVRFLQNYGAQSPRNVDYTYQHKLSGKISADATVLAKNNCSILPFSKKEKIAVIGLLAEKPHFQGGGSSKVEPFKVETLLDRFVSSNMQFDYAPAYTEDGTTDELIAKAVEVATQCDKVLLVVGDKNCESEGFDRTSWLLPQEQLTVIDAITSATSNVVIAVQSGAPVDVSWHHGAKALILDYLGGENCGALFDVVFGNISPTGRLAETWPLSLPETDKDYSRDYKRALHKESIFVGYRYYTTANVEVAFPFGYGLSYNPLKWSNLKFSDSVLLKTGKINISVDVENLGQTDDAETVQVYVTNLDGRHFREAKRLVGFKKVRLKSGEKKKAEICVEVSDFAHFDTAQNAFVVNGGRYLLTAAKNCVESGFTFEVVVEGPNDTVDRSSELPCYYNLDGSFRPSDDDFQQLYGQFPQESTTPFSLNSPLAEASSTWLGRHMIRAWTKNRSDKRELLALPLVDFVWMRKELSKDIVKVLVEMLNGKFWQRVFKLLWMLFCQSRKNAKEQKQSASTPPEENSTTEG